MKTVPGRTDAAVTQCPCCGGVCEQEQITLTMRCAHASFAVVRNVPAEVCQTCGEAQFSLPTTAQLIATLQTERTPDEIAIIPIYDLSTSAP